MAALKTVTVNWDDQDRPVITITYAGPSEDGDMQAETDAWLTALAERVSDNGAQFLGEMLRVNDAREYVSLVDLAQEADVEKKVVDGWNRNLGRTIKALVRDMGFLRKDADEGTQQLFDYQWDQPNNQWLYVIPTKYRTTLRAALDAR